MDAEKVAAEKVVAVEAMGKNPQFLTLLRSHGGKLLPYIDGNLVLGCVDVSSYTSDGEQLVELIFHASAVMFETQKNPHLNKLN